MEGVKGLRPMLDAVTGGAYSRALDSRKSAPAGSRAVVYGPGRGLWHEGAWWLTRGPGAMGGSAKQRSGQERPSLHCSSWTALLAGCAVGRDGAWDHRGTLVSLPTLLEQGAWSKDVGTTTPARGMGYGGSFDRLDGGRNTSSGRDLHSGAEFVDRLLGEAGEDGALFLAAQSTKGAGGWRWWHHTLALIVDPDAPGCVLRVAADGSRGSNGLYSGTPMDVEVWTPSAPPDPARLVYWAWKLKPEHLTPSTAPIHLEP
jgi:hypothetical protein